MDNACYNLIAKTDFFEIYAENREEEIKKSNFAIEIIWHHLKESSGKEGVAVKLEMEKKFIQNQTYLRKSINLCACGESCKLDFGKLIILNIYSDLAKYTFRGYQYERPSGNIKKP